jgi:hypothetical protein
VPFFSLVDAKHASTLTLLEYEMRRSMPLLEGLQHPAREHDRPRPGSLPRSETLFLPSFFILGSDFRRVHDTDMGGRLRRCTIHANPFSWAQSDIRYQFLSSDWFIGEEDQCCPNPCTGNSTIRGIELIITVHGIHQTTSPKYR